MQFLRKLTVLISLVSLCTGVGGCLADDGDDGEVREDAGYTDVESETDTAPGGTAQGACCNNGRCMPDSENGCASLDGEFYRGESCLSVRCPGGDGDRRFGACCAGDQCAVVDAVTCQQANGTFSEDTPCSETECGGSGGDGEGACCLEGQCGHTNGSDCQAAGGTFYSGVSCGTVTCDGGGGGNNGDSQTGACCAYGGQQCYHNMTQGECNQRGGRFYPGQSCGSIRCE